MASDQRVGGQIVEVAKEPQVIEGWLPGAALPSLDGDMRTIQQLADALLGQALGFPRGPQKCRVQYPHRPFDGTKDLKETQPEWYNFVNVQVRIVRLQTYPQNGSLTLLAAFYRDGAGDSFLQPTLGVGTISERRGYAARGKADKAGVRSRVRRLLPVLPGKGYRY